MRISLHHSLLIALAGFLLGCDNAATKPASKEKSQSADVKLQDTKPTGETERRRLTEELTTVENRVHVLSERLKTLEDRQGNLNLSVFSQGGYDQVRTHVGVLFVICDGVELLPNGHKLKLRIGN